MRKSKVNKYSVTYTIGVTVAQIPTSESVKKIRIYYTKSDKYETYYADGAIVAMNEDGSDTVKFDFFTSHFDLLEEIWHNKIEDKPEFPDFNDELKLNRNLKVRIGMSLENAKRMYIALGEQLKSKENMEKGERK